MQLKSIFIDMDGTLTNFNINYKIAYNNAIKYLTKLGITDPDILNEYRLDDILKKLEPIIDKKLYNHILCSSIYLNCTGRSTNCGYSIFYSRRGPYTATNKVTGQSFFYGTGFNKKSEHDRAEQGDRCIRKGRN